jgi:hypothetical protein
LTSTLLRTFLRIYRTASVTRAAGQLSVTQPAATGRLKALEGSLRKRLFEREGRGLTAHAAAHTTWPGHRTPYLDGLRLWSRRRAAMAANSRDGSRRGPRNS